MGNTAPTRPQGGAQRPRSAADDRHRRAAEAVQHAFEGLAQASARAADDFANVMGTVRPPGAHTPRAPPGGPMPGFGAGGGWGSPRNPPPPQARQRRQQQRPPEGPPPANRAALSKLPVVNITKEDLEGTDGCCLICLDELELGAPGMKIPCGHVYHKACITDWLERHCTCPVCRYELPTDDGTYETGRRQRMAQRKPRIRLLELENMTVGQLRALMRNHSISGAGCLEKADLVRRVAESPRIELVRAAPPVSIRVSELRAMKVSALKQLMRSVGVSADLCIEKGDLIDALLTSERVCPLAEEEGG